MSRRTIAGGNLVDAALRFLFVPAELEIGLILAYVVVVLAGARLTEVLARFHFDRARRHAEHGFEYVADEDHYRCPQGERLSLHLRDEPSRRAIYRAPAERCNDCARKAACTPHDEGRHVYRSLAVWAETDVGRFHRRLSLLMFAVGATLASAGLVRWWGQAGTGSLLLVLVMSLASLVRDRKRAMAWSSPSTYDDYSVKPSEWELP
ncbi:MAG TPA: hypothetical protein VH682_00295 [Gemmataceae bacterium]|jgi:hypothetical protein